MDQSALGSELETRREALGMSVVDLAREARISSQYVQALEEGRYEVFPAKVYAQGALRMILRVLKSDDANQVLAWLNREWPVAREFGVPTYEMRAGRGNQIRFALTPRRISVIGAGAGALVLIAFWGMRLFVFTSPPVLVIEHPRDQIREERPTTKAQGSAEKESRLTVNGRELTIDERGAFDEEIELQLGVNRLQFVSESRFGKTSEEIRYVLVQ